MDAAECHVLDCQPIRGAPEPRTRAGLLRAVGQPFEARLADERALGLTINPAEKHLLRQRVDWDRPEEVREYVLAL